MSDLGTLMATFGADLGPLNRSATKAKGVFRQYEQGGVKSLDKVKKSVLSLKSEFVGMTVAMAAVKGFQMIKEYDVALTDMGKVTKQSRKEIDAMIMGMDASLGKSTELMKGYYSVISAGVTEPVAAIELLTTASQTSKAAHVEQSQTIEVLTKMMAGYEGQIKTATDAADLLFTIEKEGQTTVSQLVPLMGSLANMSRVAGLRYQEMAGSLALVTQTAGSTAEATTQLEALITTLLKPTQQVTVLFQEFGGATEAIKKLGLVEVMERIQEAAGGSAEALTELLGGRKEAFVAFSALAANNFEKVTAKIKAMDDAGGASKAAWEDYIRSMEI